MQFVYPEAVQIKATVITDASWCPKTRAAGWAVWVVISGTSERIKKSGKFKTRPIGSQQAEQWALMIGIWYAVQAGARDILAQTDCKNVLDRIEQGDPKVWKELRVAFNQRTDITLTTRHVKGHTTVEDRRSYVNRWCDKHAKQQMSRQRGKNPFGKRRRYK